MYIYMPDIDFHLNIACSYTGVIKDKELSVIIYTCVFCIWYIVHLIQCKCCKMTDATACECLCIDQISADC